MSIVLNEDLKAVVSDCIEQAISASAGMLTARQATYQVLRRLFEKNGSKLIAHVYGKGNVSKQAGMNCITNKFKCIAELAHNPFVFQGIGVDRLVHSEKVNTLRNLAIGLEEMFTVLHTDAGTKAFVDCETWDNHLLAMLKHESKGKQGKSKTGVREISPRSFLCLLGRSWAIGSSE